MEQSQSLFDNSRSKSLMRRNTLKKAISMLPVEKIPEMPRKLSVWRKICNFFKSERSGSDQLKHVLNTTLARSNSIRQTNEEGIISFDLGTNSIDLGIKTTDTGTHIS
jgi:hypothetical protein